MQGFYKAASIYRMTRELIMSCLPFLPMISPNDTASQFRQGASGAFVILLSKLQHRASHLPPAYETQRAPPCSVTVQSSRNCVCAEV